MSTKAKSSPAETRCPPHCSPLCHFQLRLQAPTERLLPQPNVSTSSPPLPGERREGRSAIARTMSCCATSRHTVPPLNGATVTTGANSFNPSQKSTGTHSRDLARFGRPSRSRAQEPSKARSVDRLRSPRGTAWWLYRRSPWHHHRPRCRRVDLGGLVRSPRRSRRIARRGSGSRRGFRRESTPAASGRAPRLGADRQPVPPRRPSSGRERHISARYAPWPSMTRVPSNRSTSLTSVPFWLR